MFVQRLTAYHWLIILQSSWLECQMDDNICITKESVDRSAYTSLQSALGAVFYCLTEE